MSTKRKMTESGYKVIMLLLLIQLYIMQSFASDPGANSITDVDELVFAHVMFRHGNRSLLTTYETDPYKNDSYWQPEGLGQLQNSGKEQQYELGQFFRRRYNELIGPGYSPKKVYIRSSDTDRTLMSAQCNAAGLFEPLTVDQRWNSDIDWQPIPIHTIRLDEDYLVYQSIPCAKSDQQLNEYMQSKAVLDEFQKHSQLYKYLEQNSGSKVQSVGDFYVMAEALLIEHGRGLPLPDWALNVIPQLTELFDKFAAIWFSGYIRTNDTLKAKGGFLLREIFDRFKNKTLGILKPDHSLWIYSAHDNTLINTLSALKIFDGHATPCAASIHLELYKSRFNQEYYVQVFYRRDKSEHLPPIEIPQCGTKCPLQRLYELSDYILPKEYETYESLCRL